MYQTPTGKKHSLYFQLCFFSHTTIVLAFGSVVVADLGFTMCMSKVSDVVSLDTKTLSLNAAEDV